MADALKRLLQSPSKADEILSIFFGLAVTSTICSPLASFTYGNFWQERKSDGVYARAIGPNQVGGPIRLLQTVAGCFKNIIERR